MIKIYPEDKLVIISEEHSDSEIYDFCKEWLCSLEGITYEDFLGWSNVGGGTIYFKHGWQLFYRNSEQLYMFLDNEKENK